MGSIRERKKMRRNARRVRYHRLSVMMITGVVILLASILFVGSFSLRAKNREYMRREAKLQEQIDEQLQRQKEIADLKEYVGTDEYVEDVAKEKLRLVYPNEIFFKAVP